MKSFSINCLNRQKKLIGKQVISMSNTPSDDHKISFLDNDKSPLFIIDALSGDLILDNSNGDFDEISNEKPVAKIKVKNIKIDYNENLTFTLDGTKTTYRISGNCFEKKVATKFEVIKQYETPFDIILPKTLFSDIETNKLSVNGFPFQMLDAITLEDASILGVKKFSSSNGLLNLIKYNNQIYIARGHKFIPINVSTQEYYKIDNNSLFGITLGKSIGISGKPKTGIAFKLSEEELESVALFLNASLDDIKFKTKNDLKKNAIDYSRIYKQSDLQKILSEPNIKTAQQGDNMEEIKPKENQDLTTNNISAQNIEVIKAEFADATTATSEKAITVASPKEPSLEKNNNNNTELQSTPKTTDIYLDSNNISTLSDNSKLDDTKKLTDDKTQKSDTVKKMSSAKTTESDSFASKEKTVKTLPEKNTTESSEKKPSNNNSDENKPSNNNSEKDKEPTNKTEDAVKKSIAVNSIFAIASLIAFLFTGFPIFLILSPAFLGLDFGAITYLTIEKTKVNAKDKQKKPKEKAKQKNKKDKSSEKESAITRAKQKLFNKKAKTKDISSTKTQLDIDDKEKTTVIESSSTTAIAKTESLGKNNAIKDLDRPQLASGTKAENITAVEIPTSKSEFALLDELININQALADHVTNRSELLEEKLSEELYDTTISPDELAKKREKKKKLQQAWAQQKQALANQFSQLFKDNDKNVPIEKQIETQQHANTTLKDIDALITGFFAKLASIFKEGTSQTTKSDSDNSAEL